MDLTLLERLLIGPLFALVAAAMVGFLRGFGSLSRLRIWAVGTALAGGTWLALAGSGIRGEESLRRGLLAMTILGATAALLRLFDLVFWDWFLGKRRHIAVPRLAIDLFKLLAMVGVVIAVLKFLFGMELSGLLVTSTVVSAVIGLAVQDILQNVAAGLGVQIERPFKVGDWLLVAGHEGVVTQLNWRTLTLVTRDRHEIILPNSTVAKTEVTNYARPTLQQRCHLRIGIAYSHPPAVVKAALARAAQSCPEVCADPPVEILVRGFQDFSIDYDVRFFINDFGRLLQITDDVASRVWYELRRSNLTIPFPVRDVNLRQVSDDQEKLAADRRRSEIFSVLRPLPLFRPLSDEQIGELVSGAALQVFTTGESLVRQGERGDSLFVIRAGRVRIERSIEGGPAVTMAHMGPGEFFGEMSLLTGEPRTASIVAEDETEVVVVSKGVFAPVLTADTGILPGLTAALEERSQRTQQHLAGRASDASRTTAAAPASPALLRRIGRFFGIDEH